MMQATYFIILSAFSINACLVNKASRKTKHKMLKVIKSASNNQSNIIKIKIKIFLLIDVNKT